MIETLRHFVSHNEQFIDFTVIIVSSLMVLASMWKHHKLPFLFMLCPALWMSTKTIYHFFVNDRFNYAILTYFIINLIMVAGVILVVTEFCPDAVYITIGIEIIGWLIALQGYHSAGILTIYIVKYVFMLAFYVFSLWAAYAEITYIAMFYDPKNEEELYAD